MSVQRWAKTLEDNARSEGNLKIPPKKKSEVEKFDTRKKRKKKKKKARSFTCLIANFSFSTRDAVEAAEGFAFPVGLSGARTAALTAH